MKKAVVEITYTGNNYSGYLPLLQGVVSTGDTLDQMISHINEALEFHLQGMREDGDAIDAVFDNGYELEYKLTSEALLHAFSGVFTKAALSRLTGINERQLWHYESGLRKPRPAQRKRIEAGLHSLAHQLLAITL